jgi:hypothetical protein
VPEDYYSYLEGWYRSQVKGSHVAAAAVAAAKSPGSLPTLHSTVPTSFPYIPPTSTSQLTVTATGTAGGSSGGHHPGLFIPVAALQGLRSSLPGQLPQITTGSGMLEMF